ncbi:MAG: hypothetical protein U9P00_10495 [Pseudomonadota bacterium]|nr:hypothetical protein [Pseudomonadota bacterium]
MTAQTWTIVVVTAFLFTSTNALAAKFQGNSSPNLGLTAAPGGGVGPADLEPDFPPPDPPPEVVPNRPHLYIERKTTRSILIKFYDQSDIEEGFRLYRQRSGGDWEEIGSFDPIDNRSAPRYIMDGNEAGFILRNSPDGDEYDIAVNPAAWGAARPTLVSMDNTSYCYRLAPFNSDGEEPDNPSEVCATTPIDLLNTADRVQLSAVHGRAAHPEAKSISVDATEYDEAVLVRDREGLVGELYADWEGKKLVYVADNASIDLSFSHNVQLKDGLTLGSGRNKLNEGALLYTQDTYEKALFDVVGSNVHVTGLRFRGPSGSKDRDQVSAAAIDINFSKFSDPDDLNEDGMIDEGEIDALIKRTDILIDRNEFYHWPSSAIWVKGNMRATNDDDTYYCSSPWSPSGPRWIDKGTAGRVHITRNYFHHNLKQGLGYGIQVLKSAFAYIDENTFDFNRHAVAGDSRPETGYIAKNNLVLSGGVAYCTTKLGVTVYCWAEHHFDMHGACNGPHWDRGPAGEYVEIDGNTIRGEQSLPFGIKTRAAFNIRGTPSDEAYFRNNVLSHDNKGEAVRENSERNNIHVKGNLYNVDTSEELGVGDFDGDGIDDVFQATGAAWYYSSGGRTEWRFLKSSSYRIDDLVLVDYDSDGKTDVLTKDIRGTWMVSSGAVGGWSVVLRPYSVDYSDIPPNTGTSLTGDFTGDGNTDLLDYKLDGSDRRYFFVNGEKHSRHRM